MDPLLGACLTLNLITLISATALVGLSHSDAQLLWYFHIVLNHFFGLVRSYIN
jgi:hypothetical protein